MNSTTQRCGLTTNSDQIVLLGVPLNHNETVLPVPVREREETVLSALHPNHNQTVLDGPATGDE
jgi:hypothetical protein